MESTNFSSLLVIDGARRMKWKQMVEFVGMEFRRCKRGVPPIMPLAPFINQLIFFPSINSRPHLRRVDEERRKSNPWREEKKTTQSTSINTPIEEKKKCCQTNEINSWIVLLMKLIEGWVEELIGLKELKTKPITNSSAAQLDWRRKQLINQSINHQLTKEKE